MAEPIEIPFGGGWLTWAQRTMYSATQIITQELLSQAFCYYPGNVIQREHVCMHCLLLNIFRALMVNHCNGTVITVVYFSQKWLPVTTSSHRRLRNWSWSAATSFQFWTRKILTGGWVRLCAAARLIAVSFPRHTCHRIPIKCRQSVTAMFYPLGTRLFLYMFLNNVCVICWLLNYFSSRPSTLFNQKNSVLNWTWLFAHFLGILFCTHDDCVFSLAYDFHIMSSGARIDRTWMCVCMKYLVTGSACWVHLLHKFLVSAM